MQEHADGGVYCAACGELPDPVQRALTEYRAAVDEVRRAEYAKQRTAQALYEARKAAGSGEDASPYQVPDDGLLPDTAFEHAIAYVDEPTGDGRKIASDGVDWQFGQRVPVTSGFEGGRAIGHAITSHIDDSGAVMATIYVEDRAAIGSLGIGLDSTEVSLDDEQHMTIQSGRLRHVAAQSAESAAWPGVIVKP